MVRKKTIERKKNAGGMEQKIKTTKREEEES